MPSKNEIIGTLTVERDAANEAHAQAIKERDEARAQIQRLQKRDRLTEELAALNKEIAKNESYGRPTVFEDLVAAFTGPTHRRFYCEAIA